MSYIAPNTPVIIGVGQYNDNINGSNYRALSPVQLAGEAMKLAINDCGAAQNVAQHINLITAIRQFEISTPVAKAPFGTSNNVPRSIAKIIGATPEHAILEVVGGQGPQKMVGEIATNISTGEIECGAIVGSEAISTMLDLMKKGESPNWGEDIGGQLDDRGYGMSGLFDATMLPHGIMSPIPAYAIFENARRAKLGMNADDYRADMAALFAPFTKIAASNPYAVMREERSAQQLAQIDARNRLVASPYPRMMVARDQVNLGAAIIISSYAKAVEMGVPPHKMIFIHASTDAKEASCLTRPDLSDMPQSRHAILKALNIAGIEAQQIDAFDLYSCFPFPVFCAAEALGLSKDDPRGLTLTGGLPYFGGPGNNYSMHAIAEAVQYCRTNMGKYALVGANGGFASKYSVGIYSTYPANWQDGDKWQKIDDEEGNIQLLDSHDGPAIIESYTAQPKGDGMAVTIIARTDDGARVCAIIDKAQAKAAAEQLDRAEFNLPIMIKPHEKGRNIAALSFT
ncbi:hypothetical protein LPB140_04495 [Sphingorhabdus lutea]|uniref:Acetyl-CoA acetyltransferase n=1 Tax=Sphingorhabdus lutea TaxID=1913578 RepID=A0A1L3JAN0_9SPHN|nr:hypothetical protein [Sphingorhabdus lutea]APG62187.1 hypothetical protein LPB140_04495 [Sphingorhabdus lutea]